MHLISLKQTSQPTDHLSKQHHDADKEITREQKKQTQQ